MLLCERLNLFGMLGSFLSHLSFKADNFALQLIFAGLKFLLKLLKALHRAVLFKISVQIISQFIEATDASG